MPNDFKLFLRYVAPSMAAMAIAGSYSIIDTVFIGRGMGELALAALAVTWPLIMVLWGLGDMLGNGAAAIISQRRGAADRRSAQKTFANMLALQLIVCVPACALFLAFLDPALEALGANSEMAAYARPYSIVMILGTPVSMFSMGAIAVVRNDARPVLSMWLVIVGLLANIFFDWLFIMHFAWGAIGAAAATVLSQGISAAAALAYFLSPLTDLKIRLSDMRADWRLMREICATGLPIFGNMLAIVAMLYMHNIQSLRYGGVDGLAAYTLVACLESAGSMLLTGLACGVQPLAAFLHGAGEHRRKNRIGNYGYFSAFAVGSAMMAFSWALRNYMPGWCGLSGNTAELAVHGVVISSTAFLFLGVVRVAAYYYQSTQNILYSSLIIYGDAFVALPACLFALPIWFGMDGVWLAMPVSRAMLMCLLCWLWLRRGHGRGRRYAEERAGNYEPRA